MRRKEFLTKIRGFRVSLGEIEAVLDEHPSVVEAAVVGRGSGTPDQRALVAYIVSEHEETPTATELRGFLKLKLPEYMLPSAYVFLNALPMTVNGKVDRLRLPPPGEGGQKPERDFVPPRESLELQLTKIWESVLGARPIGVSDNFFDLGGNSLVAIRLFARLEKSFDGRLGLATLLEAPTVTEQARILRDVGYSPRWSSLVPIQPGGSKPPLFCAHAHDGHVLMYRDLAARLGPDQPVYGLQARGLDGQLRNLATFEEMAAHYVEEIRSLQPAGPYFLGGFCIGGTVALEMARQLLEQGQTVAMLALFDAYAPGYLDRSPKVRSRPCRMYHLAQRMGQQLTMLSNARPGKRLNFVLEKLRNVAGRKSLPALEETRDSIRGAARRYQGESYPGRVILFMARRQPLGVHPDPTFGWSDLACGGAEVHRVPGYFQHVLFEPNVEAVAERVRACLAKALTEAPGATV